MYPTAHTGGPVDPVLTCIRERLEKDTEKDITAGISICGARTSASRDTYVGIEQLPRSHARGSVEDHQRGFEASLPP
ncbi:hypothetical protein C2E23DRAFT_828134 [Lenzites betulinus]|nr:hypothetical protein C2E23DRAFT_828134 [Lenzites betulinus]